MNCSSPITDLFDEPVTVPLAPGPPTNLDPLVLADAETRADSTTVRWYSGLDVAGTVRIFPFQRGRSLDAWRELLKSQSLQSVAGPFGTRWGAYAAVYAATHVQASSGRPGRLISGPAEIIRTSGQP